MMIFAQYHVIEPVTGYPSTEINTDGTPATPELDRMHAIKAQSQPIGEFLEWLSYKGIVLAKYEEGWNLPWQIHTSIEDLLAEHFEIDLKKAENQKLALLDYFRARNESTSDGES